MSIEETRRWFALAVPEPTDKNRAVQIGCHFEEVFEMVEAVEETEGLDELHDLATYYKQRADGLSMDEVDRHELLDALADQIVTAVGVAHMFGMDIVGALNEVNRSNFSKFVDGKPIFNEHGKIMKGSNYTKPDLAKFVEVE